jgi:orotidine-5'-phosphate decarboxylase
VHYADRLAQASHAKGSVLCVGLDPMPDQLPDCPGSDLIARVEYFCTAILEAVAPHAVAVKPQSAYFEALAPEGLACLWRLVRYARDLGLLVIMDAKRGDIGSTAAAYARATLGLHVGDGQPLADAVTVAPYLGRDGVQPFIEMAANYETGLYVLVKTSNPGSGELQDLTLASGLTVYEHMGDLVAGWGSELVGESGYSAVGAVVGATYPAQLAALRHRLPTVPFLIPGYGHQGGTATDVAAGFDARGQGAVVNSARGIIYAWQAHQQPFATAAAEAAQQAREELQAALPGP